MAVFNNAKNCVEFLLNSGADMYIEDTHGEGPMYHICYYGCLDLLTVFLDSGVDVNHNYTKDNGITALMIAAARNHLEICEKLLANGADINQISENSFFPLYYAAQEGNLDIIKLFISNGVKLGILTKAGFSATMIASWKGHKEVVEYLYKQGDVVESNNQSAFIIACQKGYIDIAKFLFQEGGNINFIDSDGTALHNAVRENQKEVISYLLSIGIDTTIKNSKGELAIDIALEKGFNDIVEQINNTSIEKISE